MSLSNHRNIKSSTLTRCPEDIDVKIHDVLSIADRTCPSNLLPKGIIVAYVINTVQISRLGLQLGPEY